MEWYRNTSHITKELLKHVPLWLMFLLVIKKAIVLRMDCSGVTSQLMRLGFLEIAIPHLGILHFDDEWVWPFEFPYLGETFWSLFSPL